MATGSKSKLITPLYNHWEKLDRADFASVMLDFTQYCAKGKMIVDKQGHAVPFILNEAQREVARLILPYIFAKVPEPVTLVIHKSRQMGISVVLAALEQYIVSRKQNINLTHLFPNDQLANQFFVEKWIPLMEATHPQLMPDMYATASPNPYVKVRDFHGVSMGCNVRIGGSESRAAGRSQTNQIVILDEYAFYNNVSNLERGVLATQPKTGMVLTVYVSTSNGSNHFYDVVRQSQQPGSRIKHIFLPWHMQHEYEIKPDKLSRFYDLDNYEPTEYDMKLMDIFEERGYPEEEWVDKLNFYDITLDKEAKADQDYMFENYPSEPDESFQATGRPVLPAKVVNYWLEHPKEYKCLDQFLDQKTNKVVMSECPKSAIRQYQAPIPGHRYILSIDPSSGYAADRTAGVVIDKATNEEVCSFVEYIEQTECAELAVNLATYYNKAEILIERNMGETMIEFIKGIGYPRLWLDVHNSTRVLKYGIRTTMPLKNEAIRRMKFLLNQGIYKPHDECFLREAQHFNWTQLPGGGYRAEATGQDENGEPYHDDTVMARIIYAASLDMNKFKKYMRKDPSSRSRL